MGGCFSKKDPSFGVVSTSTNKPNFNHNPQLVEKEDESLAEKEVFVMKHRKSHDIATQQVPDGAASQKPADPENAIARNINFIVNGTDSSAAAPVRTSSCSKEELDAILIQCGRLSRSENYSGSKRSYDFDHGDADGDGEEAAEERHHQRERNRQSRPSPQGRRRTPSRERERQSQRSNSKERSSGSRRVSRSPGRRSGNTSATTNVADPSVGPNGGPNGRPGKLVSVPPTVSSLPADKGKGSRGAASPRAQSPARVNENPRAPSPARTNANVPNENIRPRSPARTNSYVANENIRARSPARTSANVSSENIRVRSPARANANVPNEKISARSPARTNANGCVENQQASLSRNNTSRKAEQSPYRRNPLSEIDPNSLAYPQPTKANSNSRVHNKSKEIEADGQKPRGALENKTQVLEEANVQTQMIRNVVVTTVPQTLTRSRSSRQSQDLDQNPEALLNPNPSYASLLLEDIQNFHHKSTPNPTSISLPPCVTKACSILEAVDDLNHRTSSNLSCTFSEDRMRSATDQFSRNGNNLHSATSLAGKKRAQHKDPFVESEVIVDDDLMEPSLQKYVTVRRVGGGELDGEESTGSNSFAGGQQNKGVSSSSWEPNSADSTDGWTSRSNTKIDDQSSGLQMEDPRRGFSGKRRDQQTGIGRGRVGGANRGPQAVAVAAST